MNLLPFLYELYSKISAIASNNMKVSMKLYASVFCSNVPKIVFVYGKFCVLLLLDAPVYLALRAPVLVEVASNITLFPSSFWSYN